MVEVTVVATVEIAKRKHFCEYREHQLAAEQLYLAPLAIQFHVYEWDSHKQHSPSTLDTAFLCRYRLCMQLSKSLGEQKEINCFSKLTIQ